MFYHCLGEIPPKRHTQFRKPDGSLYHEELVSSLGFSGIYSNLYHLYPPTRVTEVQKSVDFNYELDRTYGLKHTHLNTSKVEGTGKDFLESRKYLMANQDVALAICSPSGKTTDYFYKNAEGDEILFIHDGSGTFYSQFGEIKVRQGDYLVIPRTTIYKIEWDDDPVRLLIIESSHPVETPKRYRNELGQLMEHAPYCERDIRAPEQLSTHKDKGEYIIKIKKDGKLHHYLYEYSPLDLVGWDGFLFPYAFSIHDFEPITGRIHQPPPVHQTFQGYGFVVCSFVPRLFDYHPLSIPVPYNHSNIDSDEVLYYAEGNFMSRKGIHRGSFTLHPGGLPHGPHPGVVEKNLDAKETHELAVMIDTFKSLYLTKEALQYVDKKYPLSWKA